MKHYRRGNKGAPRKIAAGFDLWENHFREKKLFVNKNHHTLVVRIGNHWFEFKI